MTLRIKIKTDLYSNTLISNFNEVVNIPELRPFLSAQVELNRAKTVSFPLDIDMKMLLMKYPKYLEIVDES